MKARKFAPRVLLVMFTLSFLMMIDNTSAITRDEAKTAGFGFHEPGIDWWDSSYKRRIPINFTINDTVDLPLAKATVNFSDYMTSNDGIVDLASMQLVKLGENESSTPVKFQVETDAVDIWNPPTIPEIEGILVDSILQENGTFIGTVFNGFSGSGLMNQSIRFQVNLSRPTDTVKFQFVYQPEYEKGITDNDYLQIYAGVPTSWGPPVNLYRRDLPDEKAWTDYIELKLESNMSGLIWINLDAPGLHGSIVERYFSIDFAMIDGNGFERNVIHFVPELEGINDVTQNAYYPRVQTLEHELPPVCDIYTIIDENASYFLYYNLMNESNHRVIDNNAVPFLGELDIPQTYATFDNDAGSIRINTDRNETEGFITVEKTENETWGDILDFGIIHGVDNYEFNKYFGAVFTAIEIKNSSTKVTYTAYDGMNSLDVKIESTGPVTTTGMLNFTNSTFPLSWIANNASSMPFISESNGQFTTDYLAFFNPSNETYVRMFANETITVNIYAENSSPDHGLINISTDGNVLFKIEIINSPELQSSNDSVINDECDAAKIPFNKRFTSTINVNKGEMEKFVKLQMFLISDEPLFNMAYVGDKLQVALFGHNLQSISVNIDNKTGEIGFNGEWTIDVSALNRTLLERKHDIVITGRNEFGDKVTIERTWFIANDVIDGLWTSILMIIDSVIGIFGIGVSVLLTMALVGNKRTIKKRNCNETKCNVKD